MRGPLTIAVAQPRSVSFDVAANAVIHAATVRSTEARVVVFPEMSLTGYELDAPPIALDDSRLAPIVAACAESRALALVGAPLQGDGNEAYIATLAIDADGPRVAYRKVNLGGDEPTRFSAGTGPAVIDVDGWRLGLAICKDTGVPRHAADTALLGMDVYVAGIVDSAADAVRQDERATRTATEHGVWVAIASCAGSTGGGYSTTAGRSSIRNPDGVVVARAGVEVGEIAVATLA